MEIDDKLINLKNCEILIIDDTPENLKLLVSILRDQGYKVRPVPSGNMALKVINNFKPDLVLLDINMPGFNGYETCEKFKQIPDMQEVPVIFLSAMHETIDKLKAFRVGGIDYITKPYQVEEVLARVKTHLQLYLFQKKLESTNEFLEKEVKKRTDELIAMYKARKTLEAELKVASEIQRSMVPSERLFYSKKSDLNIFGETKSAKKVDGDFFDYFNVNEDLIFFCIGDISGKGIPAAIFMSKVKALLCYEAKQNKLSLSEMLVKVNDELLYSNEQCMFASVLCGYIDMIAAKLVCCNAGHTYPFASFKGDLYTEIHLKKEPVLGVFKAAEGDYEPFEYSLDCGDSFFLYSDGITEAENIKRELYGSKRLEKALNSAGVKEPESVVNAVMKSVCEFTGGAQQSDDITMVAIKYTGPKDI